MSNPDQGVTVSAETIQTHLSGIEHLAKIISELNCKGESPVAEAKDVARNCEPLAAAAKDFALRNESLAADTKGVARGSEAIAEATKELALRMEAHRERAAAANRQAETLRRNANKLLA